ncbi:hypothetical protein LP085_08265 [Achromobacter sp. MY14]|uniref:hypothetical protein n=1 Tax=unclassified Achromobacter TaxID=2626865 RepID=UPI001E594B4D|nr:hypothetical protein [Achromobacter sp. MY14]MCD0496840.1 hypothetical protein [Achromobacter sp. MY14]
MNNYDDKEIEVMSDEEIKQFVGILGKMLKSAQTKELTAKVELDQAQKHWFYDRPKWVADQKALSKRIDKLEFKLKEISNQLFYLKRTLGRTKSEINARSCVREKVETIIDDLFDEV